MSACFRVHQVHRAPRVYEGSQAPLVHSESEDAEDHQDHPAYRWSTSMSSSSYVCEGYSLHSPLPPTTREVRVLTVREDDKDQ